MAWRLSIIPIFFNSAPSHYLNQGWLIVNWTFKNKLQWNSNGNTFLFTKKHVKTSLAKMSAIFSRGRWVGGLSKPLLLVGHGWVVRVAIKWVELIVIKVKTDIAMSVVVLWNVIILTTFSSLSAQEAVILTTFGAASDANFLERPHVYFSGQLGKFLSDIAPWWHYRGTIRNSQKFYHYQR